MVQGLADQWVHEPRVGTKGADDEDLALSHSRTLALSVMVAIAAIVGLGERARAQAGLIVGWGHGVGTYLAPPIGVDFVEVAAGYNFCIARRANGTLVGWGNNEVGQTNVPSGSWVSISAGYSHAMALAADGTVKVWGGNTGPGEALEAPAGLTATAISAGERWCLVIKPGGTLDGWGDGPLVGSNLPSGSFAEVAAGAHFGIARRSGGTIAVWAAPHSECTTTVPPRDPPTVLPAPLPTIVAVAAGHCTAYALAEEGYILGWGGSLLCDQRRGPHEFGDFVYTEVVGGYSSAVAKRTSGAIVAWGAQDEPGVCDPPDFCCGLIYEQTPVPAWLQYVTVLRLAKGHSNRAHFAIIPINDE